MLGSFTLAILGIGMSITVDVDAITVVIANCERLLVATGVENVLDMLPYANSIIALSL